MAKVIYEQSTVVLPLQAAVFKFFLDQVRLDREGRRRSEGLLKSRRFYFTVEIVLEPSL